MAVKENFNKVWDRQEQDESARTNIESNEIDLFIKNQVKSILDIGCGDGTSDLFLAKKGFKITGIDISDKGLKIAKDKSKEFNNKFIMQDIFEKYPFKDNSFDAVMAYQSLNHARKQLILNAFQEIKRVLKPNGIFAIRIANRATFNLEKIKENIYYDKDYKETFQEIESQTFIGLDGDEKGIILYAFYEDELIKDLESINFHKIDSRPAPHHIIANFRNGKK